METQTVTLTEFLLARIAEDEAFALATDVWVGGDAPWMLIDAGDLLPVPAIDPRRVLAECDAKRRIVELHAPLDGGDPEMHPFTSPYTGKLLYAACGECGREHEPYCPTLRLLALPYADHPQFQEAWKP